MYVIIVPSFSGDKECVCFCVCVFVLTNKKPNNNNNNRGGRRRRISRQHQIGGENPVACTYRVTLSISVLMRVSEKPGTSLWMISFTNRSFTPGQVSSAFSKASRRSLSSALLALE